MADFLRENLKKIGCEPNSLIIFIKFYVSGTNL